MNASVVHFLEVYATMKVVVDALLPSVTALSTAQPKFAFTMKRKQKHMICRIFWHFYHCHGAGCGWLTTFLTIIANRFASGARILYVSLRSICRTFVYDSLIFSKIVCWNYRQILIGKRLTKRSRATVAFAMSCNVVLPVGASAST